MRIKFASLKEARQKKKYTLQEVANMAGVTRSYIWRIENGLRVNLTMNVAKAMCEALNISMDELNYHLNNKPGKNLGEV